MIRPILDRILITPEHQSETTDAGIVLPNPKERRRGLIVAMGPGRRLEDGSHAPMPFELGQRIVYGQDCGQRLEHDGKTYIVLGEPEVLGILEGDA